MIERMSVMNRNRKLNRISKTVISGLLVTSLVVSNGAYANAQKISKDESVYVNADESGATTKITVSNWLKNAGINGTINDESDLKDIQNVKGDETFTQNGDDVQWSAGSNDIYYQAARNFWNIVIKDHTLAIGGNSCYERFGVPGEESKRLDYTSAETCNTYNMLKLSRQLFMLDGDYKYLNYYEHALYNHILA